MPDSQAQQFRRMGQVLAHVAQLDDVNRECLMRRLAEEECVATSVGKVWSRRPPGLRVKLDRQEFSRLWNQLPPLERAKGVGI